jgi:hypothetical protein
LTRHVLIRGDDGDQLVPESPLPAEANLHDALAANPQLIPAADLGLGSTIVVGRESSLASGYADLILIDDMGQVCLVEVKKEGNPDTRQVVAQLFDYAASLWGQTLDSFTEKIVRPHLRDCGEDDGVSLEEFISASFAGEGGSDDDDVDADLIVRNLAATLEQGTFVLVVAAPKIPAGVERVLDYLNAQALRLYGLEVDYFHSQVECFVPRLSVTPPPTARPTRTGTAAPVEREPFLQSLGEPVSAVVADALDAAEEAGAIIGWNTFGATIKVALEQTRMAGTFEKTGMSLTIKPPRDYPDAPFDRAKAALEQVSVGGATSDGWYYKVRYKEASPEQLRQVADVLIGLTRELVERIEYEELPSAREETFARNDHNVWLRHAPGLKEFIGHYLRGRIARLPNGHESAVDLVPLGGDAQGWKPQFRDANARDQVWPSHDNSGQFRLIVTAVGRPR